VISTRTSVISPRRVWFWHARVWFSHAWVWFWHSCVWFSHSCVWFSHSCVWFLHSCVWFRQKNYFEKFHQILALNCKLTEIFAKMEIPQKSHTLECDFAIFEPKNLKFWILIENYITTNYTSGFFVKLTISSGIELELGPSRIKGFFIIFFFFSLSHNHFSTEFNI
jgi:hypothetical protein